MANVYNINADGGIRVPLIAGSPASLTNGLIWYDTTANSFKRYENGSTTELGGTPVFSDADFAIYKAGDTTAKVMVDATAVATATTRTITMPNANVDLGKVATAVQRDGSVAFTAAQSMGSNKLTSVADPTLAQDAATKNYADTTFVPLSQKGAASGVATLDGGGKVPVSQLPNSVMEFQGNWNASTNSPTLADGTGNTGDVYRVNVAGSQNLGSGSITYVVGDWVVYNGTIWQQSHAGADAVVSVNGAAGVVTVNAINQLTGDVTASAASGSESKATTVAAIAGTAVSGTTGTGNVMFSASPTTSGTLSAAAITASGAISGSNLSGTNTGDQTITLTGDVTGTGTGSFATTIANNAVTNVKVAAGLDAVKIGAGAVSNTEFGYLDGVTSAIQTQIDSKQTATASTQTLTASQSSATAASFTFAHATYNSSVIEYSIKEATTNRVRTGQLYIATDGTNTSLSDTNTETGDCGVTWDLSISGANVLVRYTTTANNKTMKAVQKLY